MTTDESKTALIKINALLKSSQTIKENVTFVNNFGENKDQISLFTKQKFEKKAKECINWVDRILNLLNSIQIEEKEINEIKLLIEQFKKDCDQYCFDEIVEHLIAIKDNLQDEMPEPNDKKNNQINGCNSKVFIVHGHSELLIAQTESFLLKLGLKPIILREQVNKGQTLIEKLESYTDVAFAIVLYTSCDRGGINDVNSPLKPRARQNVVFEHGYLNAKLGRDRVCALVQKGVEIPSDLSGIVYIQYDENGSWRYEIAREMREANLNVDMNKL